MNRIYGTFITGRGAVGLLIVRLAFGLGMVMHGLQKIQSPGGALAWMGPHAPMPGFLQGLAALTEFGGGLALLFGLLTPLAALAIAVEMLVAFTTVHLKHGDPFIAPGKPSYEAAVDYFGVALLMLFAGPGALSLDAWLFGRAHHDAVETPVRSGHMPTPLAGSST